MGMKQFTYTASPWGVSAPGWTVFQHTAGFEPKLATRFQAYFNYENPGGGGKGPRRLTYAGKTGNGQTVLAQCCDCGLRWWDTARGQNYFAHVYFGRPSEAMEGVGAEFNPMAWFGAPCFQEDISKELKEESKPEQGWMPPTLEEVRNLSELEPNRLFGDDELFKRCDERGISWKKLGAVVGWMHRRMNGGEKRPLAFDARMEEGVDTVAACLRMLPLAERKQAVFSTWLTAEERATFPEASKLLFFGTAKEEPGDSETGLYGEVGDDGPKFRDRKEAEAFRGMVDACGDGLVAGDWEALVSCWEAATGKEAGVAGMRKALDFAAKWESQAPELRACVEKGLKGVYEEVLDGGSLWEAEKEQRTACWVAWFEYGMEAFRNCGEWSARDAAVRADRLGEGLAALQSAEAKQKWLEAALPENTEKDNDSFGRDMAELANTWLKWRAGGKQVEGALALPKAYQAIEAYLAVEMTVSKGGCKEEEASAMLAKIEPLVQLCGAAARQVEGMEEIQTALGYLVALHQLRRGGAKQLEAFFSALQRLPLSIPKQELERDVPGCLEVGKLSTAEVLNLMRGFQGQGLPGDKLFKKLVDNPERFLKLGPRDMLKGLVAFREEKLHWEDLFQKVSKQGEKFANLGFAELLRVLKEYRSERFDADLLFRNAMEVPGMGDKLGKLGTKVLLATLKDYKAEKFDAAQMYKMALKSMHDAFSSLTLGAVAKEANAFKEAGFDGNELLKVALAAKNDFLEAMSGGELRGALEACRKEGLDEGLVLGKVLEAKKEKGIEIGRKEGKQATQQLHDKLEDAQRAAARQVSKTLTTLIATGTLLIGLLLGPCAWKGAKAGGHWAKEKILESADKRAQKKAEQKKAKEEAEEAAKQAEEALQKAKMRKAGSPTNSPATSSPSTNPPTNADSDKANSRNATNNASTNHAPTKSGGASGVGGGGGRSMSSNLENAWETAKKHFFAELGNLSKDAKLMRDPAKQAGVPAGAWEKFDKAIRDLGAELEKTYPGSGLPNAGSTNRCAMLLKEAKDELENINSRIALAEAVAGYQRRVERLEEQFNDWCDNAEGNISEDEEKKFSEIINVWMERASKNHKNALQGAAGNSESVKGELEMGIKNLEDRFAEMKRKAEEGKKAPGPSEEAAKAGDDVNGSEEEAEEENGPEGENEDTDGMGPARIGGGKEDASSGIAVPVQREKGVAVWGTGGRNVLTGSGILPLRVLALSKFPGRGDGKFGMTFSVQWPDDNPHKIAVVIPNRLIRAEELSAHLRPLDTSWPNPGAQELIQGADLCVASCEGQRVKGEWVDFEFTGEFLNAGVKREKVEFEVRMEMGEGKGSNWKNITGALQHVLKEGQ